ncbi:hypothetical protein KIN20_033147 [Parelaphostrongylus tenuis]|uniref:Gelsolin-like domain-containing protein n=1 Tax=Parelaphostrongylus tenuis TaxID=148309 RepID=A0AAD5R809_PARTN|nr:hypothetical protein KIN20_033147 [Parelaphostrongylus tenuis]
MKESKTVAALVLANSLSLINQLSVVVQKEIVCHSLDCSNNNALKSCVTPDAQRSRRSLPTADQSTLENNRPQTIVMPSSKAIDLNKVGRKEGLEIWRVNKFRLEPVPKSQYGEFYTGDAYVCLYSKRCDEWHIHFWLGEEATTDEMGVAAIKTVEIDQALHDLPVQHREVQNHESSLFLSYFPNGIRYVKGGYESGYRHENEMCAACRLISKSNRSTLETSSSWIWEKIYTFGCHQTVADSRGSRECPLRGDIALSERQGRCNVHILDSDWDTNEEFFSHFGGVQALRKIPKARNDDENYWKKTAEEVTLYRVSDAFGSMKVTKMSKVKQSELDTNDAFILDTVNGGIFVWIGKNCTLGERSNAIVWGQKYLKEKKLPSWSQITTVFEGCEPSTFTQWFAEWADAKEKKAFLPRLFQVSDRNGELAVEEIENFDQESLDGDDVMIVEALSTIYVWIGAGANLNEKEGALNTAKKYLKHNNLPRQASIPIETIYQGKETATFKKCFPKWDNKLFENDGRSYEKMRKTPLQLKFS